MKLLLISDIHSNAFALRAVLQEAELHQPDHMIILGDIFGYYPWAPEVVSLLGPWKERMTAIRGNHDLLLSMDSFPEPQPSYWVAATDNRRRLERECPEWLVWLNALPLDRREEFDGIPVRMVHGTPDEPASGRYYPDNEREFDWFPARGELLLLGHTHYPMMRTLPSGGRIINPGSVGQPRDGDPAAAWAVFNTANTNTEFFRTRYDHLAVMEKLRELNWDERAIRSLDKRRPGAL